jgi:hypothetical protein
MSRFQLLKLKTSCALWYKIFYEGIDASGLNNNSSTGEDAERDPIKKAIREYTGSM